jgi:citrate lyase subunit beta/citryl-CoA lyase/(S)-citramalyl-CoA lyase
MAFRSLLFVPGDRPDRYAKAKAGGADAVCVDLEDAVAPLQKTTARAAVAEGWLAADDAVSPLRGIRINALSTHAGFEDVALMGKTLNAAAFVMIPKVQHRHELDILRTALGQASPSVHGQCPGLWPIIESACGLEAAYAIAAAPGVAGVLFGGADFSADIGSTMDWEALSYARGRLAAACGAAGVQLLDVPYLDVRDAEGLKASTMRAKALGFTGRACIHPDQIASVNAVFSPTVDEIAKARRIIAALHEANGAAALLDGKLIERPVILAAQRVLDRAGVM